MVPLPGFPLFSIYLFVFRNVGPKELVSRTPSFKMSPMERWSFLFPVTQDEGREACAHCFAEQTLSRFPYCFLLIISVRFSSLIIPLIIPMFDFSVSSEFGYFGTSSGISLPPCATLRDKRLVQKISIHPRHPIYFDFVNPFYQRRVYVCLLGRVHAVNFVCELKKNIIGNLK